MTTQKFRLSVDGNDLRPAHAINLKPGAHEVALRRADSGRSVWTAWPVPADPSKQRWLNRFRVLLFFADGTSGEPIDFGTSQSHPEEAAALAAFQPGTITTTMACSALFFIMDSYSDDSGGLTIEVRSTG